MKCTGCGTPIESFYSAPDADGRAGHYCSPACVAQAVEKWTEFSCHVCWFEPERGSGGLHHVARVSELRRLLQPYENHERLVIYLDRDLGESGSVWVHITGQRAFVSHTTLPGGIDSYCRDSSCKSRNDTVGFLLSNGQLDEFHWTWTVPRTDGVKALEYFLEHGDRDPSLSWGVPRTSFLEPDAA